MLKSLINSTDDLKVLKDIALDLSEELKEKAPEEYNEIAIKYHAKLNGYHFTSEILEVAVAKLKNEDGSTGAHWSVEQTTSVAKSMGINFDNTSYNEYDWNYVLNMIYSDYYGAVQNETSVYAKLAKKFLEDKDGSDCKALKYYLEFSN